MEPTGPVAPGGPPLPGRSTDALARATRALREEPEPGWRDVMQRVSRTVREVSRPGRPLLVDESSAGELSVDQRVVVDVVRRALERVPGCRPVGVAVASSGRAVTSLQVEVWARYGDDVVAVAAAARSAVTGSLADVLGRACPVDVVVVDVERA